LIKDCSDDQSSGVNLLDLFPGGGFVGGTGWGVWFPLLIGKFLSPKPDVSPRLAPPRAHFFLGIAGTIVPFNKVLFDFSSQTQPEPFFSLAPKVACFVRCFSSTPFTPFLPPFFGERLARTFFVAAALKLSRPVLFQQAPWLVSRPL